MITFKEASDLVKRHRKIISRDDVSIHSSTECSTHWVVTYAVPSLEDKERIFQYATVIIEKQSGYLYYPPSRSSAPIDYSEFPSNRHLFKRITSQDLADLENELGV